MESKYNPMTEKQVLNTPHVIARLLMLFKPKCPKCGSRNNKVECYAFNPYDKNEKTQTGRQCNDCPNFWYQ